MGLLAKMRVGAGAFCPNHNRHICFCCSESKNLALTAVLASCAVVGTARDIVVRCVREGGGGGPVAYPQARTYVTIKERYEFEYRFL